MYVNISVTILVGNVTIVMNNQSSPHVTTLMVQHHQYGLALIAYATEKFIVLDKQIKKS